VIYCNPFATGSAQALASSAGLRAQALLALSATSRRSRPDLPPGSV